MRLRLRAADVLLTSSLATAAVAAPVSAADAVRVDVLLGDPGQLASWIGTHDRDALAAAERVGQVRADVAQSHLWPNPSFGAGLNDVTVGETNPPGLHLSATAIYGLTLSQTIEIAKRGPRIASARLRLGAEHESYLETLSEAIGQARLALAHVAYLKSRTAALEESLQAARQVLALQRSRLDNGDLSGNDFDRLLLDTTILESDVAESRSEYQAALQACRASILIPTSSVVSSGFFLVAGTWLFHEQLPASPVKLAFRLAGTAAAVLTIFILARQNPDTSREERPEQALVGTD